jgi:hypothetical protein
MTVAAPRLIDPQPPGLQPWAVSDLSCPSTTLCVALDGGQIGTSTDPAVSESWSVVSVDPGHRLTGISCPSTTLCVAVDDAGEVWTSTAPAGGPASWTPTSSSVAATGLTCPSAGLCIAYGGANLYTSTDPAGGANWTAAPVALFDVSCASASLCVGVGGGPGDPSPLASGNIAVSTDPSGGASAWTTGTLPGVELDSVSCTLSGFCGAAGYGADDGAYVATSRDPAAGAGSWSLLPQETDRPACSRDTGCAGFSGISCTGAASCVAVGGTGTSVDVASDAASGDWTPVDGLAFKVVACPSTSLCLGVTSDNVIEASTEPLIAGSPWRPVVRDGRAEDPSFQIACPSASTCIAADGQGNLLASAAATSPAGRWTAHHIAAPWSTFTGVSCPTSTFCAAVDTNGNFWWSRRPLSSGGWRSVHVTSAVLSALSCPSASLCVAVTAGNDLLTSTAPTRRASPWRARHVTEIAGRPITELTCPSTHLCLAAASNSQLSSSAQPLLRSTDPARPASWHPLRVPPARIAGSVNCASSSLCVVEGGNDDVWRTTDPGTARPRWTQLAAPRLATQPVCPTLGFCAALDRFRLAYSPRPTDFSRYWRRGAAEKSELQASLACPAVDRCVTFDDDGDVIVGSPSSATRAR